MFALRRQRPADCAHPRRLVWGWGIALGDGTRYVIDVSRIESSVDETSAIRGTDVGA
jgi:hypothetical protein